MHLMTRSVTGGLRLAVIAAAAVGLVAGCSSSGSSSNPGSSAANTSSTGAASSSTAANPEIAAAQAYIAPFAARPTVVSTAQPLTSPPPKGKTYVSIDCDDAQCKLVGDGVDAAAKLLGWNVKHIPFKLSDPATLIAGMQQALQLNPKPVAVTFCGIPQAVWQGQQAAFTAAGVGLVPCSVGPLTANPAIYADTNGTANAAHQGQILANWFINDSNGAGKALLVNTPDIGALNDIGTAFQKAVKSGCAKCTVTTVNVTLAQVGANTVSAAAVSALQRDGSIRYVFGEQGGMTAGLPSAMAAAGLSNVKYMGTNPATQTLQDLLAGRAAVFTNTPYRILGFQAVDAAVQHLAGKTADESTVPTFLLTKDTVVKVEDSIESPSDYSAEYSKLWDLG